MTGDEKIVGEMNGDEMIRTLFYLFDILLLFFSTVKLKVLCNEISARFASTYDHDPTPSPQPGLAPQF